MLVRKDPETAPLCPQCGDAMRLARKLPPVRPLSGLVVHLCGGCGYVGTAEREPDPPPPKWLRPTRGVRYFPVSCRHSRTPMIRHGRPAKDEADLSSLRGAHEARQATALARPQTPSDPPVSVHRLRACRHGRVARVRRRGALNELRDSLGAHHTCGYRLANGSRHRPERDPGNRSIISTARSVKDFGRIDAANRERAGTLTPRLQSRTPSVAPLMPRQVQRAFAEAGRAVTKRTAPGMPSPISEFAMPPVSAPKLPAPATTKAEQQKDSADVFGEAKPLPGV